MERIEIGIAVYTNEVKYNIRQKALQALAAAKERERLRKERVAKGEMVAIVVNDNKTTRVSYRAAGDE